MTIFVKLPNNDLLLLCSTALIIDTLRDLIVSDTVNNFSTTVNNGRFADFLCYDVVRLLTP